MNCLSARSAGGIGAFTCQSSMLVVTQLDVMLQQAGHDQLMVETSDAVEARSMDFQRVSVMSASNPSPCQSPGAM